MSQTRASKTIETPSAALRFAERIVRLRRIVRIALAAVPAVATTLLITPIIDNIYVTHFFDFNTRLLPALVSAAIGVIVYLVGWALVVGYAGVQARPRRAIFWYFALGGVEIVLILMLLMTGALDVAR